MYFVCGLILGMVAMVSASMLSSNTLQWTLVQLSLLAIFKSAISSISLIIGIAVLNPSLIVHSAFVVLSATSACILEAQVTGQPAYVICPFLDFAIALSIFAVSALQFPQKSA